MNYGWLSILPPIIAIILALLTKEVIFSLIVGIFAGGLIFTKGNILLAIETVFSLMAEKIGGNGSMLIFLGLLGALVYVMNRAGGSYAYGQWAGKRVKTKGVAQLLTAFLGMLIFIDDYFNCLTVGAVMKPITDKNNVSRAKLAYLIDSTAAPICIIAPVSSWAASIISTMQEAGVDNPMNMFSSTIPFNLYAILTIISVIYFSISKNDIGIMQSFSKNDISKLKSDESKTMKHSEKGRVFDMVIPILVLIFVAIYFMLRTGGFFAKNIPLRDAFGEANVNLSLVVASVMALIVAFILYIPRKLMTFYEFMDGINEGVKTMTGAIIILILAWTIGGITKPEFLGTGEFISESLKSASFPVWILPALIFAISAFLSFATGTAWGTFGIIIPIMIPVIAQMGAGDHMPIILSAILSGSIFGDHCSPISDTTILSSAGASCNHLDHVKSQMPYALIVSFASIFGFLAGGYFNNALIAFAVGFAILAVEIKLIQNMTIKKYGSN